MEISFSGKGSAFCPVLGSTGASFVVGDNLFVLDCGESVFQSLYTSGVLDRVEHVYVLLTHLHADHVGSLGSLISYSYCIQQRVIHIFHPSTAVVDLLRLLGIRDHFYTYHQEFPVIPGADLTLRAYPVQHVDNMACFGYTIKYKAMSFYYSGDAADLPEEVTQDFLSGRIQTVYHDTATVKSAGHCYYELLAAKIPPEHRSRLYCMHLDGDSEGLLRQYGFSVVEVAE